MPLRRRASATAVLAVALLAGLLALLPSTASAAGEVFISEIHYDDSTAAGDTGESIEVQADPATDLAGWKVYLHNGGSGTTYANTAFPTPVTASGVVVVSYPTNGIQNGTPDGIALVRPDNSVAEFISYEGSFTATDGPANEMVSIDVGVGETSSTPPGHSLQKIDGVWKAPATSSFGTRNTAPPIEPGGTCTDTGITHTIAEVQGAGTATPVPGAVKVTGVVTADERTGGYNGAYIQTAGTGGAVHVVGATTASTGTFVYFGSDAAKFPDLAIGDRVEVSGTAGEFNGLTQITSGASSPPRRSSTPRLHRRGPDARPLRRGLLRPGRGQCDRPPFLRVRWRGGLARPCPRPTRSRRAGDRVRHLGDQRPRGLPAPVRRQPRLLRRRPLPGQRPQPGGRGPRHHRRGSRQR